MRNDLRAFRLILVAGLCGGVAEIAWIALYGATSGIGGWEIAREVTATVVPPLAGSASAEATGLAIHLLLAIGLAAAFVAALRFAPAMGFGSLLTVAAVALAGVWAVNFLVVLPQWNPRFVALLPLGVTLTSKLLFGLAMAAALAAVRRPAGN